MINLETSRLAAPKDWVDYIHANLNQDANHQIFSGAPQSVITNMPAFEALGMKYLVTPPVSDPFKFRTPRTFAKQAWDQTVIDHKMLRDKDVFSSTYTNTNDWPAVLISSLSIPVGAISPSTTGIFAAKVCTKNVYCTEGVTKIKAFGSKAELTVNFVHPLHFSGEQELIYMLSYYGPGSIDLFLSKNDDMSLQTYYYKQGQFPEIKLPGLKVPISLKTMPIRGHPIPPLVFKSPSMYIYRLGHYAPYASAPGCKLQIITRDKMVSDCPTDSSLIRRELFYPRWHATINGISQKISSRDKIFQKVMLPTGHAVIRFWYIPSYMFAAVVSAIMACLLCITCLCRGRRRL